MQRRSQTRAYPGIKLLCPTISSLPSYKNGVQVIKVYIAISYSTKKFPKPLFLAQWTAFSAGVCCALIRIIITSCAKMKADRSGDTTI